MDMKNPACRALAALKMLKLFEGGKGWIKSRRKLSRDDDDSCGCIDCQRSRALLLSNMGSASTAYCLLGAGEEIGLHDDDTGKLLRLLDVATWNDAPSRTFQDVRKRLESVIVDAGFPREDIP